MDYLFLLPKIVKITDESSKNKGLKAALLNMYIKISSER